MLGLLLLLFLVFMFLSIACAMARAGRRRRMFEEQRRRELERRRTGGNDGGGATPFAGLPFGGLLDAMLGGSGAWTRTLEYDESTGWWVDVCGQAGSARHGRAAA